MGEAKKPRSWSQIVGERVRARRTALGWSRGHLAVVIKRADVDVSAIEEGQADLTVEMLLEVAFALGIDSAVLAGGLFPSPRGPQPWLEAAPPPLG